VLDWLIPDIVWTDANKQVVAGVIGALLGAVIGAISTFVVSERARKKQIELNEIDKLRQKIKASIGSIVAAQNNLHNLLVMCLKNKGHFRDMTKGIFDTKTKKTVFTMNLPQLYEVEPRLSDGMANVGLTIQWTALETEVVLHNANIKEFNDHYGFLRTSIHTAQLSNSNDLNVQTILSDSETITNGAKGQMDACDNFRARSLVVLALIDCHVQHYKKIDYRKIKLADLEEYYQKLVDQKPKDAEMKKKLAEFEAQYTEEKAFGTNEHFSGSTL